MSPQEREKFYSKIYGETQQSPVLIPGPPKKKRKPKPFYYTAEEWASARDAVFLRDGKICYLCQTTATQVDHVLPKSKFPELALHLPNLKPICWPCNRRKNTKILPVSD